jgi:hypothetical protein
VLERPVITGLPEMVGLVIVGLAMVAVVAVTVPVSVAPLTVGVVNVGLPNVAVLAVTVPVIVAPLTVGVVKVLRVSVTN